MICFDCTHFDSKRQNEDLLIFCGLLGIEILPETPSCGHFKPCLGLTCGNGAGKLAFPDTVKPGNGLSCIPNTGKIIVKTITAIIDDLSANADYYHTGKGNHVRPGDGDTPVAHSARERTRLPFSL